MSYVIMTHSCCFTKYKLKWFTRWKDLVKRCDGCEKIEINRWINNKERHRDLT